MAGTFPGLTSGKLAFNGTEIVHTRRTQVKRSINFKEQRWKAAPPLLSGTIVGDGISAYDVGVWKEFFDSQKGEKDTFSLVLEDPLGTPVTYNDLCFTQDDFTKVETRQGKFNCRLSVRQIKAA